MSTFYEIIPEKIPADQLEKMKAFVNWARKNGCMVKRDDLAKPIEKPVKAKKAKSLPNTQMIKMGAIFGRRESTHWSQKEIDSFKLIKGLSDDDILSVQRYYNELATKPEEDFRRTTLQTLLNNWQGEVDRARNYKYTTNGTPKEQERWPEPNNWVAFYEKHTGNKPVYTWGEMQLSTRQEITETMKEKGLI